MLRMLLFLAFLIPLAPAPAQAPAPVKSPGLKNPILPSGPDPWVIRHGSNYYFMATNGRDLTVRRTQNMADLAKADIKIVWTPPASGPYSKEIWAPELHFLNGKWYLYFAADAGTNESHRIFALEGCPDDPLTCTWSMKGKVSDPTDRWAIDADIFSDNGKTYLLWSGWPGATNGIQNIYIAQLSNPWTITGDRVLISTPQYDWEKAPDRHININEGPQALIRNNRIFVLFSANGCWTDNYALGLLVAKQGSDLLNPKSWTKTATPVFTGSPEASVYSPGHNSFFQGSDGQDWLMYHANIARGQGCGDARSPRAQPFSWKADGTPDFGRPQSTAVVQPRP